jgi:hydrogenase maturation factor
VSCADDRCVTCSDEGVPMRVVATNADGTARCDGDVGVDVMVDLVGRVEPGDRLLVHAGVALARLD